MKTRTTPEQREELARLARGATPGPWTKAADCESIINRPGSYLLVSVHEIGISESPQAKIDTDLIVSARNILLDLLADLEDALAEVAALEACKADDGEHRCELCGDVIPGDGTEDADWRTVCEDCEEAMDEAIRAVVDGGSE